MINLVHMYVYSKIDVCMLDLQWSERYEAMGESFVGKNYKRGMNYYEVIAGIEGGEHSLRLGE